MAHLATAQRRGPEGVRRRSLSGPPEEPGRTLHPRVIVGLISLTALAMLEVASQSGAISGLLFPPPSRVAWTLVSSLASGELSGHLAATLARMLPGLAIGAIPGLALGMLMGRSTRLRRLVDPFVAAAHPIPKIALLPLFMLLFGIGDASKIAIVALAAFFPCLINAMAGARGISPLYLDVARSYGAGRFRTFTHVLLPGSLPVALSGLRLAANVAIVVTIGIELVAADQGLGALIWLSWEILRVDLLYATILLTSILGIVINGGLTLLSRKLAPWAFATPGVR